MSRYLALVAFLAAWTAPAFAGPASDAVRFFYIPVKWEADAKFRDRFTGKARELFDLNDKTPEGEMGCIDFGPGIDAQDYDDATIKKTLKISEEVSGDTASVTARFTLFPGGDDSSREILWSLNKEDGKWKIADITSVTNGWKLSELECSPQG